MRVLMPQLGETVAEGTVTAWRKKVGERVEAGETLYEVTTDKVDTELPAPVSGVLTAILVPEGTTVKVGEALATIDEPERAEEARAAEPAGEAERLSPVVRKLLAEHGLQASDIKGTGAEGRITRRDVLEYVEQRKPAQSTPPGAQDERQRLGTIRKRTAERMSLSWRTIPHVVQAIEVDFQAVEGARAQARLTYLPFVARAVCEALEQFPLVNASFAEDEVVLHRRVNLGIAVDLGGEGLVVPVVKDAAQKSLADLARAISELSEKARAGKLQPDDVSEGTYTISNNGRFGTLLTAPIINPPQVAILSLDGVAKKPAAVGESVAIRPIGVLAQSFDHRAFDGAYSAGFLRRLKEILEGKDWTAALSG